MLKKSPSDSLCPYFYMGGELHPLKYGSYHSDRERLFAVMAAEEAFILQSPGQHNRRIWVDLYETTLDEAVIDALIGHIRAIEAKVGKLCFVGCSPAAVRKLRACLTENDPDLARQAAFFSDPEEAKRWPVGKG